MSFTSSPMQSIKLLKSENAWKPMHKVETTELNMEDLEKEQLKRSVQGILNKLTPQEFKTLLTQLKNLNIDTEEKLNVVSDLIFENAVHEPNVKVPFANLCKCLASIKVPLDGQPRKQVNFLTLIRGKCQKEYEKGRYDDIKRKKMMKAIEAAEPENKKVLKLELDEGERKMRYRRLGCIRFIGELFKVNMIRELVMHECIKKFLSQEDEESLEYLCTLLKVIGKKLDDAKAARHSRDYMMDPNFSRMQNIVDKRVMF